MEDVPGWREQITFRALVVSLILGCFLSAVSLNLNLSVGVLPSLNLSAALLGFIVMKLWTQLLSCFHIKSKPFTRQENTVIQTCVGACCTLAFSGGFGSWLLALDPRIQQQTGDAAQDVKALSLGWIIALLVIIAFLGILAVIPFQKLFIVKYSLPFPSCTATATMVNSFHTDEGSKKAKKQAKALGKTMGFSFFWGFFKWFFSGGDSGTCGFDHFPSLGLKAFQNKFYFDFGLTYIGAGMICPHIVNVSMLLGAILSWGLAWPLLANRAGESGWYPEGLKSRDFAGLYGYKVFFSMSLIVGEGLYQILKIFFLGALNMYKFHRCPLLPTVQDEDIQKTKQMEKKELDAIFLSGQIPIKWACLGYLVLAALSIGVAPQIIHQVKWYYVLICYIIAPIFGFGVAYGSGLTDWNLASTYGKLAIFIFASWAGAHHGGVVVGLVVCGLMMTILTASSDIMGDFKTGYLTKSSPTSMFISEIIGTAFGCVVVPPIFWLFWKAFKNVGGASGHYPAPYAAVYRQMSIIGVKGFSALPGHCMQICYVLFTLAILIAILRDLLPRKYSKYIPIPMAMGVPFYIGAFFTISSFIGTVIKFVWEKVNKEEADVYVPAVASGLICGEGLWSIPSACLALAKVEPPLCMTFFPTNKMDIVANVTANL